MRLLGLLILAGCATTPAPQAWQWDYSRCEPWWACQPEGECRYFYCQDRVLGSVHPAAGNEWSCLGSSAFQSCRVGGGSYQDCKELCNL